MELFERNERRFGIARQRLSQQAPVGNHGFTRVFGRKSEVQFSRRIFWAIGAAHSADPGTEATPKPGEVPIRNRQPRGAVGGDSRDGRGPRKLFLSGAIESGCT